MLRSIVIVSTLVAVTSGCSVSHSNRSVATLGGAAIAVAGVVIAKPTPVDSDGNGRNDWFGNDDYSGLLPGTLMVISGVALLIAGLNASDPVEEPRAYVPPPALAPAPGSGPVAFGPTFDPAPVAVPERASLPELPATPEVLQLAKQVRAATANSQCDAALTTWARLSALDPEYAQALLHAPLFANCAPQPER